MKICGIVCEYNPFHNGHIHHINQTRQLTNCDVLIAVMSGNFVQRGEPAIVSKYQRTKAALTHGVDLVIELPFIYATQSAEYFAKASMHLLQLAGCSCFCFGSESNDLITLQKLAKLESPILDKQTSTVCSYEKHHGLLHANDILGINYLKYCGKMQPFCIQRSNLYFDEHLQDHISSATSIRKALQHHQDVAHTTPMEIKHPIFLHDYYPMLQMLLSTLSAEYLHSLFLMDEGIEHLLIKNAQLFSFEEFIQHSISKKYTQSRIQRTCIHLLNQTTKAQANQLNLPQYVRILGATATGRKYLKSIPCQTASRFNQIPDPYRQMEMKAAIVYASGFDEQMRKAIKESELQFPLFL